MPAKFSLILRPELLKRQMDDWHNIPDAELDAFFGRNRNSLREKTPAGGQSAPSSGCAKDGQEK